MQESMLLPKKNTGFADYTFAGSKLLLSAQTGTASELVYAMTPTLGSGVSVNTSNNLFGAPTIKFTGTGEVTLANPRGYSAPDPGTGDFTVESEFNISNILLNPANNAYIWPIFIWGSYFSGTQPMNMALYYIENSSGITGGQWVFVYQNASLAISANMGGAVVSRNVYNHIAVVRKSGQACIFLNGKPIMAPIAFTASVAYYVAKNLFLGRCDGGSGNVFWYAVGDIASLRICNIAKYWGTFTPPPGLFPTS